MKEIAILNIKISINRLLFRLKNEKMNDEKRENLQQEVKDLDYCIGIITKLDAECEKQFKQNTDLILTNLRLRKQIEELSRKELEI